MEVTRTSMIHAAAPHFLWSFAVRYAAEQLNLWPRVSHPETSPTLQWTGEVGDASAFRFYHPGSRRMFSSRDVTFDESVCFYRLHPHRSSPVPLPPLSLVADPPPVAPLPPPGPTPLGVSQVDPPPLVEPLEVSSDTSGPAEGGHPTAADTVAPRRSARLAVHPGFPPRLSSLPLQPIAVDSGVVGGGDTGDADSEGSGSGGAASHSGAGGATSHTGAGGAGGSGGAGTRRQETLSPERLREWAIRWGSPGGGTRHARAAATGGTGPGRARAGVPGAGRAGGTGVGGTGANGVTGGAATVGAAAGGPVSCRQEPLLPERLCEWAPSALCHLLSLPPVATEFPVAGTTHPLLFPPTDQSQPQLLHSSPLPAPAPHTEVSESLTERREPETHASTPICARHVACPRALAVPGIHRMALCPSYVPRRIVLPLPPASSLPHVLDPESGLVHTASQTVTRLLAAVVTDPSFESAATSALVSELVDFAALCRLHYAASLVFYSSCPPSVRGELALGYDILEDRQFELECLAAAAPHLASTLLCLEGHPDALDIPTPRSYAEAITVPPLGTNIFDGMWIFRVKRPPGSPPVFKARYVARGFSQHEGVDFFQTFSPTPKMTTLRVLLHGAAQRDYELHSLDFSTAFLQGSLHEAIWLRRPCGFTGSFLEGTQWSLRRPVYGLRHAPREWHDTLRTTLEALGFAPSSADPSLFLRTDTSMPPFYVLLYVDDLVFATADTEALALVTAELRERHTCTDLGPSAL
ncbi:unnamed protein product [Closterium sp. NIES-53]